MSRRSSTGAAGRASGWVVALVLLAACGSDSSVTTRRSESADTAATGDVVTSPTVSPAPAGGDIATVVYEFHDASVPPEYHRSYTLTVTAETASLVVDSYGDVVAEDTAEVDPAMWASTLAAATAMAGTPSVGPTDCAGGTSDELIALDAAGTQVYDIFADHCAEGALPDLAGVVSGPLGLFDLATMTATE